MKLENSSWLIRCSPGVNAFLNGDHLNSSSCWTLQRMTLKIYKWPKSKSLSTLRYKDRFKGVSSHSLKDSRRELYYPMRPSLTSMSKQISRWKTIQVFSTAIRTLNWAAPAPCFPLSVRLPSIPIFRPKANLTNKWMLRSGAQAQ